MSVKKTDISQIKKYLAGELDAKAMHQLERRALDDPFLQDALDGFEAKGFDQPGLDALSTRLQERVNRKEARVIPWRTLSIAASILLVIGLGGAWLLNRRAERPKVAQQLEAVRAPVPDPAKQTAIPKPDSVPHETPTAPQPAADKATQLAARKSVPAKDGLIAAEQPANKPEGASKPGLLAQYAPSQGNGQVNDILKKTPGMQIDSGKMLVDDYGDQAVAKIKKDSSTKALTDMIVMGYGTKKKNDSTHLVTFGGDVNTSNGYFSLKNNDTSYLHNLTAKLKGVTIEQPGGNIGNAKPVRIVNGQILPAIDQHLTRPNAATSSGYDIVDADGNTVRAGGYDLAKSRRVKKSVKDSLSMVAAATSPVMFNEEKKKNSVDTLNAHPIKGWKALTDYLNANATSADKKTGLLKISFTVEASGLLDNFKIVYSLSAPNDQKIAGLLRNGPAWAPNASGKPETVTLTVRVH